MIKETLPLSAFWDPRFLKREMETLFRQTWLCFPKIHMRKQPWNSHTDDLYEVLQLRGNAARFDWMGESIFFKRDFGPRGTPELRCFLNRCPHAFYPLLAEESDQKRSKFIQCQQHGLTAECDGTLRSHPGFSNPDNETKAKLKLREYPLAEWNDFYFINRGTPSSSFENAFQEVIECTRLMPMDKLVYRKGSGERRVVEGNWKLHAWNYMDALHINWVHKGPSGLQDAVDMSSYKTELYDEMSLQWVYARNADDGFEKAHLPERFHHATDDSKRVYALWFLLFPNVTLNFYPWGLSVNIYSPVPGEPQKTEFFWHHFVWDEKKYAQRETRWLSNCVDAEDVDALTKVSRNIGASSEPERTGVLSLETEKGPIWFHALVAKKVGVEP